MVFKRSPLQENHHDMCLHSSLEAYQLILGQSCDLLISHKLYLQSIYLKLYGDQTLLHELDGNEFV